MTVRPRSIPDATRRCASLLAIVTTWLALVVPGIANAQSVRCIPGFGPAQPEDRCDQSTIDSRNPLPDAYLAIALSANGATGAGWDAVRGTAQQTALGQCTRFGGQGCRIVETYFNTCASVARSDADKIVAISALKGAGWNASGMAMAKCRQAGGRSCRIAVTACANGYVSPRPYVPSGSSVTAQAPVLRRR